MFPSANAPEDRSHFLFQLTTDLDLALEVGIPPWFFSVLPADSLPPIQMNPDGLRKLTDGSQTIYCHCASMH